MSRARDLSKLANPEVFSVDSVNNVGLNSLTPDAKLDVIGFTSLKKESIKLLDGKVDINN